ncbi:transposase [Cryobacterium sp. CAN_C3]|nr:transposase [Cryobacterium sp. CAN_C3]
MRTQVLRPYSELKQILLSSVSIHCTGAAGTPAVDVAEHLGVSVPTLYRWIPASTR